MVWLLKLSNILLLSISFASSLNASNWDYEYCEQENSGWNFYCDPEPEQQESKAKPESNPKKEARKELSPKERLLKMRERYENLEALTILEPTTKNILAFNRYKQEMLDRATQVTAKTQELIWQTPELNYDLKKPVSTLGRRTYDDLNRQNQKKQLQKINKEYGLIYFMRGSCPYCKQFSPIIKGFTEDYNIEIKVISTDGTSAGTFKDFKTDNGISEKFNVKAVPAVYLYRSKDQMIVPISTGFIARDDLENRIYKLTKEGGLND